MLAAMATALDAARLLVWRAALSDDAGKPFTREAPMAKLFASEMAVKATHDAQQVPGGHGYSRDMPVETWYRDVRPEGTEEGTSQIQRLVIARGLLQ
jgi:alkylation response protein AidB-like acyl-CoA dehydrogenase